MNKLTTLLRMILRRDRNLLSRFEMLRYFGEWILPVYRFKWPQLAWWDDLRFNDYLSQFNEIKGMNTDRRWMLYQLMRLVKDVPGDTAECGVYEGAGSYIICILNEEETSHQRMHYIFDSFEGLSTPSTLDGTHWTKGDLSCNLETAAKNLSSFSKIRIYKGWIPERFSDVEHHRFCFVHIDVDLYQPTLDSIDFFYPRMNEGGLILCDDYGFTSCPGATKAIDQFLKDRDEKMVSLSCGGGFLIKGCATSEPLRDKTSRS